LEEWRQRVKEQRARLNQSARARGELRMAITELQQRVAALTQEKERLSKGCAEADVAARCAALQKELEHLREARATAEQEALQAEGDLEAAKAATAERAAAASAAVSDLEVAKAELSRAKCDVTAVQEAVVAAEARLHSMVAVGNLQAQEAEIRRVKEEIAASDREARQLRLALAEAISSGADLPNTLKELEFLKESTAAATKRMQAVEAVNAQLQARLLQVNEDIRELRKGAIDLKSEGELMREVIVEQSEQLLRRVEDLTDERKTADADRKQLLATTADLLASVEREEARIAQAPEHETACANLEGTRPNLVAEVERLRRTNDAMCQQVLGEDSEGPFAGTLRRASVVLAGDEDGLHEEVARLVRGQQLLQASSQGRTGANVQLDAAQLALRLQQALAEREESFWVERQRLSDRVMTLERARGGRTGALLREYNAAVRGTAGGGVAHGGNAGGAGASSVGAFAAAGRDAASAAAGIATGGWRRLSQVMR